MPLRATRCSVSFGESSLSQSRAWLVNQSCLVIGWKSKPTELRTPRRDGLDHAGLGIDAR